MKKSIRLGYHSLHVYYDGPMGKPGAESNDSMMASFQFDTDISPLFPYINAVAEKPELHENPSFIRFHYKGIICVVYPDYCLITPVCDREHAKRFMVDVVELLNDITSRKDEIKPKYKLFRKGSVVDILKLLPQTNCRECGFSSCMVFAAILSRQQTIPARCPYIEIPLTETVTYPVYDENGKLKSTLMLHVDMNQILKEQKQQKEYISQLEKKISLLSEDRKQEGRNANSLLPIPLTDREIHVLRFIASGATNTEISEHLHISSHTVKSHVINIFNKLAVNDRTQAAVWAVQNKLI